MLDVNIRYEEINTKKSVKPKSIHSKNSLVQEKTSKTNKTNKSFQSSKK